MPTPSDTSPSDPSSGEPAGSTPSEAEWGTAAVEARRQAAVESQRRNAPRRERWIRRNRYYFSELSRLLRFLVEPGQRVLGVRCENGHLLEAMRPSVGVGVEISPEMTELARLRQPDFRFETAHPEHLDLEETFDYILFSYVNDTVDVLPALERLKACSESHTRLLISNYSRLWEPILRLAELTRIKMPLGAQNWLSDRDLELMLDLAGFEKLRTYRIVLLPMYVPLLSRVLNRFVARLPLLNRLCLSSVIVARLAPREVDAESVKVSVIVPCKNEEGNVEPAVERIPPLGAATEVLFCVDQSTDGTVEAVRRMQAEFPEKDIRLIEGPGISKAGAVFAGFRAATGDVLMILDADLTVMPEELPYFLQTFLRGKGELVNGSRLVYPMQGAAMKTANLLGNKAFSLLFTYVLGHRIKDTLCGTKVLSRRNWQRIEPLVGSWGAEDCWGDYDLLFGASRSQLKIVDLPVHYQERVYGTTKVVRVFSHGVRLLRMSAAAFIHLRLGY